MKTLLLVDDDTVIHESLRRVFRNSPYTLISAFNGDEALEKAAHVQPDLVLLDVQMPEKDGYSVVREMRSNKDLRKIPILMLTGLEEVIDHVVGYELGVEDYLTKPFDLEEVKKHVSYLLETA